MPHLTPPPFAEISARNMNAGVRVGEAMAKGMAAYQKHMVEFVQRRIAADMETAKAWAGCRNAEDAARLHAKFTEQAIGDYFKEWHALLSIGADVARGVVEPLEETALETAQDVERRQAS